jgi:hypothetical protein
MGSGGDPPMFDSLAEEYERHAADNAYNALYDRPAVSGSLDVSLVGACSMRDAARACTRKH